MTTARDVKDALHARYNRPSQGRPGERYVCIEEARSGAGFDGNNGQCDFLAVNTWRGRGMELIGHEVKVSMADWRAELAAPEKAERFARFCRRWFVAAPSALATKIRDEVPPAWGLLSLSEGGRLTEIVKAKAREPEDVPDWYWVGWLAQIDRQHKRDAQRTIDRLVGERLEGARKSIEERIERDQKWERDRRDDLDRRVERLAEATGLDLRRAGDWSLDRLAEVWALSKALPDLRILAGNLRRAAEEIEEHLPENPQ